MAFEKTELTEEEKDYISKLNIKNPSPRTKEIIKPTEGVVDRERNIYLFLTTDENWSYENSVVFVFIWKSSQVVARYILEKYDRNIYIKSFRIPEELHDDYIEIIDNLNEAILVYKQNCAKIAYPLENYTVFSLSI